MYNLKRYTMRVRAAGAPYGDPAVPDEEFSAAGVLRDLTEAPDGEIPLILARYATLRAWLLQDGPCGDGVAEHALSAARAHLAATAPSWPEGRLLERVLDADPAGPTEPALALLEEASRAADATGHVHGARSLRQAAYQARWWTSGYPPSSLS